MNRREIEELARTMLVERDDDDDEPTHAGQSAAIPAAAIDDNKGAAHVHGTTYTDPTDGTVYEWDSSRAAWFPRVDEAVILQYQLNYGGSYQGGQTDPREMLEEQARIQQYNVFRELQEAKRKRDAGSSGEEDEEEDMDGLLGAAGEGGEGAGGHVRAKKAPAGDGKGGKGKKDPARTPGGWYEIPAEKNSNVYVSGLPEDITIEEFVEHMSKCGLPRPDDNGQPSAKIYRDAATGQPKGDGLFTYIKAEAVPNALLILDGSRIRGHVLSVQRAKFEMRSDVQVKRRPKKKKAKEGKGNDRLLAWDNKLTPDERRTRKAACIVILKHMFAPSEFDEEPSLLGEISQDVRDECSAFGEIAKVVVYDRHPEGVISIKFKEASSSDKCIQKMNGRFFAGRRVEAALWDGKASYVVEETEEQRAERMARWDKWIEDKAAAEAAAAAAQSTR